MGVWKETGAFISVLAVYLNWRKYCVILLDQIWCSLHLTIYDTVKFMSLIQTPILCRKLSWKKTSDRTYREDEKEPELILLSLAK